MHLAEGILPAQWAAVWTVPAMAGAAAGLRKVKKKTDQDPSYKPLLGLMGAAVFAISLMPIPVPVAGSVSHPAGTPLAAIVVGPLASILLAALSLLLQALFFAHGGLTTLGANVVSEGIAGSMVGFFVFWTARRSGRSLFTAGLLAGMTGDLAVYAVTATELSLGLFPLADAGPRSAAVFLAFLPTQLPLAVLEGVVTGSVLRSLAELRPDVAEKLGLTSGEDMPRGHRPSRRDRVRGWWHNTGRPVRVFVGATLVTGGLVLGWGMTWAAARSTGHWVGLDEGIMEATAEAAGRAPWDPFLNTDQGDLLLFVFFWGAAVTGLAAAIMLRRMRAAAAPEGPVATEDRQPQRRTPFRSRRGMQTGAAALLLGLATWTVALPQMGIAGVDGGDVRLVLLTVLRPTTQEIITAQGGDLNLLLFMMAGLAGGGWAGMKWGKPRNTGRGGGRHGGRHKWLRHLHPQGMGTAERHAWVPRGLGRMDARVKIIGLGVLLGVNLVAGSLVSLIVLAMILLVLLGVQRIRITVLGVRLAPALLVAAVLVALHAFTEPGRQLAGFRLPVLGEVGVTWEGIQAGGALGLVVMTGVTLVLALGLTTPLPSLLSALRWFRVPELLIELGMLMYRYLFLFAEEAARMRQAQRLRGFRAPWRRAMGGYSALGATLLIRSYERSQRVYDAQRLRGAKGGKGE